MTDKIKEILIALENCENEGDTEKTITQALREVERETWLEAAKMADAEHSCTDKTVHVCGYWKSDCEARAAAIEQGAKEKP